MTRRPLALLGVAASAALVLTACTGGGNANDAGTGKLNVDLSNLSSTTVPGTAAVDEITWNLPYEPLSLDPQHSLQLRREHGHRKPVRQPAADESRPVDRAGTRRERRAA